MFMQTSSTWRATGIRGFQIVWIARKNILGSARPRERKEKNIYDIATMPYMRSEAEGRIRISNSEKL